MASFTDNTQALSTFNPYVQQLPVETMVKVGMQKQEQYNQGIQKIQTSIDNIAGLDIARDADKAYLQSKVNELGNNLKFVAAGDFSDFSLVNSVNGMTSQLVKDSNIKNAVASTAKLRKEQQYKEEARKAGKSSAQNDWDFNVGANNYLNSSDLKGTYNGHYTNYTNMDEKLRKLAKDIHESDTSYDNPFQRDAAGNTLYFDKSGKASTDPRNGNPKQDDAMLHVESKAKSAQKILTTFYDSLSPDDINQLSIDGRYHYKDASADTFKQTINSNYIADKKVLSEASNEIALKIQTGKLSPTQKAQYEAQLTEVNKKLNDGGLEKSRDEQLLKIDNIPDIEGYKSKLYTQSWLTNLAQDISYDDKKYELKTNPYEQANDRRLQLQLAYNREAREASQWSQTFARDNAHWEYEQQAKAQAALAKQKTETFSAVDAGAIPTNINIPSLNKLGGEISSILGKRNEKGEIIERGAIDNLNLKAFALVPGGASMTYKQKETYLSSLSAKYAKDPGSINGISNNPGLRKYVESRRNLEIDLALKQSLYNKTAGQTKNLDATLNNVYKTQKGVVDRNGKELYSAKELYEATKSFEKFTSVIQAPSGSTGWNKQTRIVDTNKLMQSVKGKKNEMLAKIYIKSIGKQPLTQTEQIIENQNQKVYNNIDHVARDLATKKFTIQSEYLAKHSPERQTQVGTLNMGNKDTKARVVGLIGNLLEKQNSLGEFDVTKKSDADRDVITSLLSTGGSTYTVVKKSDGTADIVINGSLGTGSKKHSVRQSIPITAAELENHFPEIAQMNPLNRAKQAIESSGNHTTNLFHGQGTAGAVNSMFSGYDLPQLAGSSIAPRVRFDIEGNPDNDGSSADNYTLKMYVQPHGSSKWVDGYLNQNYVPLSGIQETINAIGDTTIDSFLTKNK